jgi:hypothetical protein
MTKIMAFSLNLQREKQKRMNKDSIENLAKIAVIVWTSYQLYEKFFESQNKAGNKIREDYKFAKDFFEEREKNPDLHKFVVELGYLGITHDRGVTPEVVEYLLSLQKPETALFWFKKTRRYLDFSITSLDQKIRFKSKYREESSRIKYKNFYLFLYVLLCFGASYPLVYKTTLSLSDLFLWVIALFIPAWMSLTLKFDIELAEKLVGLQPGISISKKSVRKSKRKTFGWINRMLSVFGKQEHDHS